MKKRFGLISLGLAAALVAVVITIALVARASSGGDVAVPAEGVAELAISLDEREGAPIASDSADGDIAFGGVGGAFVGEEPISGDDVAPPLPEFAGRKIIRDATVSLGVEDVGASVRRVEAIASGAGGFVSSSSVFMEDMPEPSEDEVAPPRRTQSASVTIRVPSSAYASVMNQIRGLDGELQSESSTTSDVSEEFADLEARLRNLEATEARYLELLDRAETIPDILTLQDRINSVRLEIERIQGRINLLNDLTDLATIVVQLSPLTAPIEAPSEPGWAQQAWDNAWEDSQQVLEAMGTAAIVIGVVLAWLAVPVLVIAVVWRLFGPRRPRGGEAGGTGTTA